jgi:hypothetical protein
METNPSLQNTHIISPLLYAHYKSFSHNDSRSLDQINDRPKGETIPEKECD